MEEICPKDNKNNINNMNDEERKENNNIIEDQR